MRNRHKTLLRDHSVPEVTLKACLKHTQSQPYLRPSLLKDIKDLPSWIICSIHLFASRAFLRLVVMPWSLYYAINDSVRPSTVGWRGMVNFMLFFIFLIFATSAAVGCSGDIWSSWLSLTSSEEYSKITLCFICPLRELGWPSLLLQWRWAGCIWTCHLPAWAPPCQCPPPLL